MAAVVQIDEIHKIYESGEVPVHAVRGVTLTIERGDAATRLDPGVLTEYERRRARFGGVAVAKLDGSRCGGCFLDLSTVELAAVRATPPGDYADCPQCGRMLVP